MEKHPIDDLVLIPSKPYEWTDQQYFSHIESVCTALGEYVGGRQTICRTGGTRLAWAIRHHSDTWGNTSEYYDTLEEAIHDFIALNPKPDLT